MTECTSLDELVQALHYSHSKLPCKGEADFTVVFMDGKTRTVHILNMGYNSVVLVDGERNKVTRTSKSSLPVPDSRSSSIGIEEWKKSVHIFTLSSSSTLTLYSSVISELMNDDKIVKWATASDVVGEARSVGGAKYAGYPMAAIKVAIKLT
jgi:hypothetical protein